MSRMGAYSDAVWVKNALDEDSRIGRLYEGILDTNYLKLNPPRMSGVELCVDF
jgi:hypothetical protein